MELISLWNHKKYQELAEEKTRRKWQSNPGYKAIFEASSKAKVIVEIGCSVAPFLEVIKKANPKKLVLGLDIALEALKSANKRGLDVIASDSRKAPIADNSVNLVYTVHTLEHIEHPELVIDEMIRILKPGGKIIIMCPNLASPLSKLPGSTMYHTILRMPYRILKSIFYLFFPAKKISWNEFKPISSHIGSFEADFDAVNQPNLQTLAQYIEFQNFELSHVSSAQDWPDKQPMSLLGRLVEPVNRLGRARIKPFVYYGYLCFVIAIKN